MKINYTRLAIAIFCSFTVVTRVLGSQLEENNESRYLRRDRADKNEKVGSFGEDRFLFQVRWPLLNTFLISKQRLTTQILLVHRVKAKEVKERVALKHLKRVKERAKVLPRHRKVLRVPKDLEKEVKEKVALKHRRVPKVRNQKERVAKVNPERRNPKRVPSILRNLIRKALQQYHHR